MGEHKVLVVHDDSIFVDRLRKGISEAAPACTLLTALSAPRALGIVGAEKPQCLIVEAGLVGLDGYALCAQLKADPNTSQLPVIIVANNPDESSAMRARQAGARAHLASSGAIEPIVAKILEFLPSNEQAEEAVLDAVVGGSGVEAAPAGAPSAAIPAPPTQPIGASPVSPIGGAPSTIPVGGPGAAPVIPATVPVGGPGAAPVIPATVPVSGPIGGPIGAPVGAPSVTVVPPPPPSGYSAPSGDSALGAAPESDVPHVDDLLRLMLERGGSDLHISVGGPPVIRQRGELIKVETVKTLTPRDTQEMIFSLLSEEQRRRFDADLELDFAYSIPGVSRFRANVFQQRNSIGAVFRVIPIKIPTMEELGLPRVCKFLAERPRGLVLVTGPTGSGKSTTLASMINHINTERSVHIITLEDPIEFMHPNKKAVINQREVGEDTHSFASALKRVLRQDPDVILVGELRDLETISAAITAAETGHLVLATLHTTGGPETVDRVIDVFPPHQQQQVRMQLSTTLEGVVSQTLLRSTDGRNRVMAMEIMLGIPAISNLIREGKTHQMETIIQGGAQLGMQTLDQSLKNLLTAGKVSFEEAISKAKNPRELAAMVGRKL